LTRVGCSINLSKTCYKTPFRESCGSEWFAGIDVTIIRNRKYQYTRANIIDHPALCDLQRKFFAAGLFRTADFLYNLASEVMPTCSLSLDKVLREDDFKKTGLHDLYNHKYCRGRTLVLLRQYLTFFDKSCIPFDRFPFCLSFQTTIPRGAKIRYNRNLQRSEVRIPLEFQRKRDWITGGYPRLMARLLGDQIERIVLRDRKVGMAWTFIPL
jgi:hypothetical protein